MENTFVLRPYGKTELALAYTHNQMSPRSARNWLNSEIDSNPVLSNRLAEVGYYPKQHIVTLAQLRLIVETLGEP